MKTRNNINRRSFIKRSSAVIAASTVIPTVMSQKAKSSNDKVNVAVIGIRSRGAGLMMDFAKAPGVHIHTLCDIDENLLPSRAKNIEDAFGYKPNTEWDMRKVFDNKDIDAVVLALPNHWHALATVWASKAGKHVYVEKPSSYNIYEGQKMVEASEKYGNIVQVGYQNRSRKNTRAAMKFIHEGNLGDIYLVRGLCYRRRWDIGRYPDGPMKADEKFALTTNSNNYMEPYTDEYLSKVHYDEWMGPAKKRPFNRNRFHYNWHWQWEYGNGDTGNQGPHQFDIAVWGLNKNEYPVKVSSKGGFYLFDSQQDTPNIQTSLFEYADGTMFEFSTRGLYTNPEGKTQMGVGDIFFGSKGWLEVDSNGDWKSFFGYKGEPGPDSDNIGGESIDPNNRTGGGQMDHINNFIEAVKANDKKLLNCDITVGRKSDLLSHLGNIAYQVGGELMFDGKTEKFVDNDEANKLISRESYRKPYDIIV